MIYIIFRSLYNLFDLCCINLCGTAKHWDSFLSDCIIVSISISTSQSISQHISNPNSSSKWLLVSSLLANSRTYPSIQDISVSLIPEAGYTLVHMTKQGPFVYKPPESDWQSSDDSLISFSTFTLRSLSKGSGHYASPHILLPLCLTITIGFTLLTTAFMLQITIFILFALLFLSMLYYAHYFQLSQLDAELGATILLG